MRKFTKEQKTEICTKYKGGASIDFLRVHYGCRRTAIVLVLDEGGIEKRKKRTAEERARMSEVAQKRVREKNANWRGGMTIHEGRRFIKQSKHPDANMRGYVRNSRLVMEGSLGRFLLLEEEVHHINGDTLDDRPENLMLFPNHSSHTKHHVDSGDHPRNEAGQFVATP